MARTSALVFVGLVVAVFGACSPSKAPAAPDLSCGAHTCTADEKFDVVSCSCVPLLDMSASQMDLGETD